MKGLRLLVVAVLLVFAVGTGCEGKSVPVLDQVKADLDCSAVEQWAVSFVARFNGDTSFVPGDRVCEELPPCIRNIAKTGFIGPTAISVKGQRVELMWIDSWGHGFEISAGPGFDAALKQSGWVQLASGIFGRSRGPGR